MCSLVDPKQILFSDFQTSEDQKRKRCCHHKLLIETQSKISGKVKMKGNAESLVLVALQFLLLQTKTVSPRVEDAEEGCPPEKVSFECI